jgi:glycosyltransferase involved in cell wall biosynthesis
MKKKKVLYICSEAASGMIHYATAIIQAAAKSPLLDVYAIVVDDHVLSYRPCFRNFPAERIVFLKIPGNRICKYYNKIYPYPILREAKRIHKQHGIDIIHLLTADYTCSAIIAGLKKSGEIYYTVHDVIPHEKRLRKIKDQFYFRYMKWGVKSQMNQAQNLVTNSKEQYLLIQKMYPEKNLYFHPFPSLISDALLKGKATCPEIEKISRYILFFGNIEKYKGVEYLYRAFRNNRQFSDYKLVIAGSGNIHFANEKDSQVIFINRYIKDEEIRELFKQAACVVYPYLSATQSGVLTLAYQFQTPALVSDIPFFREVSNKDCCLFFRPADVEDLADKLEVLLFHTDPETMKAAQKAYYEQNYSEEALIASIEAIYSSF